MSYFGEYVACEDSVEREVAVGYGVYVFEGEGVDGEVEEFFIVDVDTSVFAGELVFVVEYFGGSCGG